MRMSIGPSRRKLMPRSGVLELRGAHAEIGNDSVDSAYPKLVELLAETREHASHEHYAVRHGDQPLCGGTDGCRIPIERDDPRLRFRFEKRHGMPARSERGVDIDPARFRRDRAHDLTLHHGRVLKAFHFGSLVEIVAPDPLH
jgi:hypothetical protein